MSFFDQPPLHNFPDRAIRRLLQDWRNLRDLVADLLPELAARLDFEQAVLDEREFLLQDWQKRESDLLFRIPYLDDPEALPILLCLLIEHQSEPDPWMPLRTLLYAVLYWDGEWKAWEEAHDRRAPARLTPVVPIVLHTGAREWRTWRTMADLFAGPEALRAWAPKWEPRFWDLASKAAADLAGRDEAWLKALAVVRAERGDAAGMERVFVEVVSALLRLPEAENVRRQDLLWFLISWVVRRLPREQADTLVRRARLQETDTARGKELETMVETAEKTWCDVWREEGEARGETQAARRFLTALLESRFAPLSAAIEAALAAADVTTLDGWYRRALQAATLDEVGILPRRSAS